MRNPPWVSRFLLWEKKKKKDAALRACQENVWAASVSAEGKLRTICATVACAMRS
jgi:hypothetical protein